MRDSEAATETGYGIKGSEGGDRARRLGEGYTGPPHHSTARMSASSSMSSNTIIADFPPSSSDTFRMSFAHSAMIADPVATLPVNVTFATSGHTKRGRREEGGEEEGG